MDGVIDALVRAELRLDVLIAQQTHLRVQLVAMGAEDAAVQRDGRQQSQRGRAQRFGGAGSSGLGHGQGAGELHGGGDAMVDGWKGEMEVLSGQDLGFARRHRATSNTTEKKTLRYVAMLPTPSTSHVPFDRVYEPAEDSFLLLDTLSAPGETQFLTQRFHQSAAPAVVEVGSGSGVVLAFVVRHAATILGRTDALALAVDISQFACRATCDTVHAARDPGAAVFLDAVNADLGHALRRGSVDVLIFNPPYVPTQALPDRAKHDDYNRLSGHTTFEQDSYLLELAYAGGVDGMETTDRLLDQLPDLLHPARGVAYILLCAQNKPLQVQQRVRSWGPAWAAELVGSSGKQAGWEKLQILRISRVQ